MHSSFDNSNNKNEEYSLMIENFIDQKGDKGAELLSILGGYIKKFGYNNSSFPSEDQEEVLQEVFIKIFKNHKKIKENSYGWLFKVTNNECLNRVKKNSKSNNLISMNSSNEIVDIKKNEITAPNLPNDIEDLMDCFDHIFDEIVKQSGNEHDRDIYIKYVEGLKNIEISKITNRTESAIAKRLTILKVRAKELFIKFF